MVGGVDKMRRSLAPTEDRSAGVTPGQIRQLEASAARSDHGTNGVAGNGETITCTDNNGWRWEPS